MMEDLKSFSDIDVVKEGFLQYFRTSGIMRRQENS
jgi:hypothetical protein